MKNRLILLLSACMLLTSCNKVREEIITTFPDGSKQLVYQLTGSKEHPIKVGEIKYYDNGKRQYEKHFSGKDETPSGIWEYFYPSGTTFATGDFDKNHDLGDDWKFYNKEGKPYFEGDYDSVAVLELSDYQTPATIAYFSGKTTTMLQFYSNCILRSMGKVVDGKKEGKWVFYHDSGVPQTEATFIHGLEHGPYTVYRREGIPYYRGFYQEGRRTGKWEFYNEDGTIAHTQEF